MWLLGLGSLGIGVALFLAWFLAIVAIPLLIVFGIGTCIVSLFMPDNGPYSFEYSKEKKRMVKKRA